LITASDAGALKTESGLALPGVDGRDKPGHDADKAPPNRSK
jgi:hypothetical protein